MKFSRRSYLKPTPKNLRKLGDALLAIGGTLTGIGIYNSKTLAIIALSVMLVGKFLTNFFSE